ncbi:hypothetical protein JST56_02340 [Candidatus Dependentiae bacterium]|nr:hypothetical protein [Candidatus Dependentiae bacterium]
MKKLIMLVLSIGIVHLCHFDEVYAVKGYVRKRGSNQEKQQSDQVKVVENNSNQPQQQPPSDISNALVVEVLASSVEKLEISDVQDLVEEQLDKQQEQLQAMLLVNAPSGDDNNLESDLTVPSIDSIPLELIEKVDSEQEHSDVQMSALVVQDDLPKDQQEVLANNDSLPHEEHIESVSLDQSFETKVEAVLEEELVDILSDHAEETQQAQSFRVTFRDNQEKEVFTHCDSYRFCEFMSHALKRMSEPETVSMVRHYGFGLGHVPLLLVWSSHLFDRLQKSDIYCMETQDLKDILMLMLIVDLRAQVDAACIEHMKKSSPSRNALAVQTDSKVIEQATSCTPCTAGYLKRKLVTLWLGKIQEMYRKKKLPCFSTILQKVKHIASEWQDDQLQSPIWVCCVMHKSYMTFNNLLAGWPAERFGNWWNPESSLIIACQACDYSEIRKPKTDEVLTEFEKYASWPEYFGDIHKLEKVDDAEYDSDGGF